MSTYARASNVIRYLKMAAIIVVLVVLVVSVEARTYQGQMIHEGPLPAIYGDDAFKASVLQAMDYLATNYPADYENVVFWLAEIRPTDTYTRVNSAGVCHLNADDYTASYLWLASVLIHEAQHVNDDAIYFVDHPYSTEECEHRALNVQAIYLEDVNGWTGEQADAWVDGWMAKRYWETIPEKYN